MTEITIDVPEDLLEHLDENAKDYQAVILDLLRRYRWLQNRTGKKHSVILQDYFSSQEVEQE